MIIKKIDLRNFQCHEKLVLDLDQFSAIVGPSSAGKSSVLRALAWLFYGDWDKTFPRDLEKDTSVAIQLENGTIWGRFRKGARNWAMCRKPGEKPLTYQDFGDTIPGILDELNVRPIKIGSSRVNLNFSMQDDPIFMVHEPKPTKAQWIGRLYGAHIINQMLRLMSKDKRTIESDKKSAEEEEGRLRSELDKYIGLDDQAEALERTSGLLDRLQAASDCQSQMLDIMRDVDALRSGASLLNADTESLRASLSRLQQVISVHEDYLSVKRESEELGKQECAHVDTTSIREDIGLLEESRAKLVEYRRIDSELEEVTQERYKLTSRMECLVPQLEYLRKDIQDALFADGQCPLCHSKPEKLDMVEITNNLKELVRSA